MTKKHPNARLAGFVSLVISMIFLLGLIFGASALLQGFLKHVPYYNVDQQRSIILVLAASTMLHIGWGYWEDRGGGGLHTLLVLALGHIGFWTVGLRIEYFRFPGFGLIEMGPVTSLFFTIFWLSAVAAVIEWMESVSIVPPLAAITGGAGTALFIILTSPMDNFVALFAVMLALAGLLSLGATRLLEKPLPKSLVLPLAHWIAVLTILARLKGPAAGLLAPLGLLILIVILLFFGFAERSLSLRERNRA